jgi:signal transduction histidine kinase
MDSFSQKVKTLRRFVLKYSNGEASFDKILLEFINEFEKVFPDLQLKLLLIDGANCWQYSGNCKQEVLPEYRGFLHHLKKVQSAGIFKGRAFRAAPSITGLFKSSKYALGIPCQLVSGNKLWALLGFSNRNALREPDIKKISGLLGKLTERLSAVDYSEIQKIAERFKAQEEAVATLVHQLKSPFSALTAALKKAETASESRKNEILNECRQKMDKAGSMISAYLDFLKIREIQLSSVPVSEIIKEVENYYQYSLRERGIELRIQSLSSKKELTILGHPVLVFEVIQNLIENAEKAIGKKGNIDLKICLNQSDKPEMPSVEILVLDSGPGVDPAIANKMFEPFFSRFKDGHGLGLSICRRIMELHGGNISYIKSGKKQMGGFLLGFKSASKIPSF